MTVHLVNPSDLSFGISVITPRWLFVLAGATPKEYGDPVIVDETIDHFDPARVQPGDVVGIGIHTLNALRGYKVGKMAREAGAKVIFGGVHATLYPEEAVELGGAHSVVKGRRGSRLGGRACRLRERRPAASLRGRAHRGGRLQAGSLGSNAERQVHGGFGTDGSGLSQALLLLLGLADGRAATTPARVGRRYRGDRRAPSYRVPLHRPCRRQLLSQLL